jgi:hypothetical protein
MRRKMQEGAGTKVRAVTARVRSLIVRAVGVLVTLALLLSCSSLRYVRKGSLAGSEFVDRLELSGQSFRLERSSDEGTIVYGGSYRVDGEMWTFVISAWSTESRHPHRLDPPLLFLCRGRSFDNGLAFFAPSASHSAQLDVFLSLPSDFDLER